MSDKRNSQPIKQDVTVILIGERLRRDSRVDYLIYQLILKTGIPLKLLLKMTVQDIAFSQDITFKVNSTSHTNRFSHIPRSLQNEIGDTIDPSAPDAPAFIYEKTGKPVTEDGFRKRLARASLDYGFEKPGISVNALRKTFLYRMAVNDMDKALNYSGFKNKKKLAEYLGYSRLYINDEGKNHTVLYDDSSVLDLLNRSLQILENIKADYQLNNTFNRHEAHAIIQFCKDIAAAEKSYKKETRRKLPSSDYSGEV